MCTTSMTLAEINTRLDEPANCYKASSPSSISEVQLGDHCHASEACIEEGEKNHAVVDSAECSDHSTHSDNSQAASSGENSLPPADGRTDVSTAGRGYINADVAPALSTSPTSRKRRWSDVAQVEGILPSKRVQLGEEKPPTPTDDDQAQHPCEMTSESSVGQPAETVDDYDDDVYYSPAYDIDCSEEQHSRRTLYIEYWSRTDECKERKWDHLDEIAENYGSAEEHIFATTLNGIEHWTLWHVRDLTHEQVKQYVENWIDANAPHVQCWNYDDNPERSIDIFHVHVYFQVGDEDSVLQGRKVDDLMHECD